MTTMNMKKFIKRTSLLVAAALISLFAAHNAGSAATIADLTDIPQKPSAFLPTNPDDPIVSFVDQLVYAEDFMTSFFAPWGENDLSYLDLSMDQIIKFHQATAKSQLFKSDGKLMPKSDLTAIADNGKLTPDLTSRPGIIVTHSDVRVLPSANPLYPSAASALGKRGLLKQDVLQNSTLKPGEPVAVFAQSKDGNWYFVASGTVVGWVPQKNVAFVDITVMERYLYNEYAVFIRDNVRLTGADGAFITIAKMGTVMPLEGTQVILPVRGKNGFAELAALQPEQGIVSNFPLPFTARNAAQALEQVIGEPYAWGGLQGHRDCSAMTMDYFALFGVRLPRNSGDQAMLGASIPLKNLSKGERIAAIVERGIPFATLIHMPGHIMLYLGTYNGKPVVIHNVWGVRILLADGQKGRAVIGKTAITTLEAGLELKNRQTNSLFIDNVGKLVFPMAGINYDIID